jgi:hypothetical protein
MKDYHVFFPSDGTETFPTGGLTVDEIKKVTLATLGTAFAKITTVDETIDLIRRKRSGDLRPPVLSVFDPSPLI